MALSSTWWALDWGRKFSYDSYLIMIEVVDDSIIKGATLEHPANAIAAIKSFAPNVATEAQRL